MPYVQGTNPNTVWTKYFLEDQDWYIKQNMLFQDNQSAMKLEQKGILSSSQCARHTTIQYWLIKDRVDKGDCPTECMLADFFTKPLQGKKYCQLRDIIMGVTTDDYNPQEHVRKTEFGFLSKKTNENCDMNRVLNNMSHGLNMILKTMRSIVINI